MGRTPVKSSQIASIGHDEKSLTLEIEFHNKKVYQYQPITSEGYQALRKADSIGKFFTEHIKNNKDISCLQVLNPQS